MDARSGSDLDRRRVRVRTRGAERSSRGRRRIFAIFAPASARPRSIKVCSAFRRRRWAVHAWANSAKRGRSPIVDDDATSARRRRASPHIAIGARRDGDVRRRRRASTRSASSSPPSPRAREERLEAPSRRRSRASHRARALSRRRRARFSRRRSRGALRAREGATTTTRVGNGRGKYHRAVRGDRARGGRRARGIARERRVGVVRTPLDDRRIDLI